MKIINENILAFFRVVSANIIVFALSLFIFSVIPNNLDAKSFGYWQLFLFYTNYIIFLLLGFGDGLYLKYGGYKYDEVDKDLMCSFFWGIVIYTIVLAISARGIVSLLDIEYEKRFTYVALAIVIILQCVITFFLVLSQSISKFKIYSNSLILEKIVFAILLLYCFIFKSFNFKIVIIFSIISKLCVIGFNIFLYNKMIFRKPKFDKMFFKEIFLNIKSGIFLMLSTISAMFMSGFGRIFVEKNLGIEEFAYYSFVFSTFIIVTQVISAIAVVLYPLSRTYSNKRITEVSLRSDNLLSIFSPLLLLTYFPLVTVIKLFFPMYINSILYLSIIYPTLVYQTRISMIYNTLYKSLRFERLLLKNNLIVLVFNIVLTMLMFKIYKSSISISVALLVTYIIWHYKLAKDFFEKQNIKYNNDYISIFTITLFLFIVNYFTNVISFIILFIYSFIILYKEKDKVTLVVKSIKLRI